jgi:WD40 repeat protein
VIRTLKHPYPVKALAFSPDGEKVLTGTSDEGKEGKAEYEGEAQLWETASGTALGKPLKRGWIDGVAFSPDGKDALVASFDRLRPSMLIWDMERTTQAIELRLEEGGRLRTIDFSSNGKTVMLAHRNGVSMFGDNSLGARTWEPNFLPNCAAPIRHGHTVSAAAFSPDSRAVVTNWLNKTARIWRVTPPVPEKVSLERIKLWAQLCTGYEVSEKDGILRNLDGKTLLQRRQLLDELGGPPFCE